VPSECIASIARVSGYKKFVVARLAVYDERAVLGVVPAEIGTCLQIKSQLILAAQCQLTEQVITEPEAASFIIEPDFKLSPRALEDVDSI